MLAKKLSLLKLSQKLENKLEAQLIEMQKFLLIRKIFDFPVKYFVGDKGVANQHG